MMKNRLFTAITAVSFILVGWQILAADAEPQETKGTTRAQAKADLQVLIGKVQGKVNESKKTETDFADELKEFDALLAKYKDEKIDEVAQILLMKAMLYLQIFDQTEKGTALITQ